MVSRSAVGLFQSLPLLHVAGTVAAEKDPQSLQTCYADHTGRVNANGEKNKVPIQRA